MNSTVACPGRQLGPLDLLVLQPTPYCNIGCSYCYLPDRLSRKRMPASVLDRVFSEVFCSGLVRKPFTVVWHAGEPLVLPPEYYADAFARLARHNGAGVAVTHSFQTNGTLLNHAWCDFIKDQDLRVGVSVDGPEFLHDSYRKTRRGEGTLARTLAGISRLRQRDIGFHVITVLTRASLDYPDELFDFYCAQGIERIGFNMEEIEGPHTSSSLQAEDARAALTRFLSRFFELVRTARTPMFVREFDNAIAALLNGPNASVCNHQTAPFAILSVDCDGNCGTFSPELLGLHSEQYGTFALGNLTKESLAAVTHSPRLMAIESAVQAGVDRCKATCPYFDYCGGGAPVNKYFENGSFDSTETMYCRLSRQTVVDVVLEKLEHQSKDVQANVSA